MRATDLIGCDVYGSDGERIGRVHDLRFEMTWTGKRLTLRLSGFDCRDSLALGHRLGYGQGEMAGPWPLKPLFERRMRARLQIDWADVETAQRPDIVLRRTRRELESGGDAR